MGLVFLTTRFQEGLPSALMPALCAEGTTSPEPQAVLAVFFPQSSGQSVVPCSLEVVPAEQLCSREWIVMVVVVVHAGGGVCTSMASLAADRDLAEVAAKMNQGLVPLAHCVVQLDQRELKNPVVHHVKCVEMDLLAGSTMVLELALELAAVDDLVSHVAMQAVRLTNPDLELAVGHPNFVLMAVVGQASLVSIAAFGCVGFVLQGKGLALFAPSWH